MACGADRRNRREAILLDAFALALSGRGDAGWFAGLEQGQVTAVSMCRRGHPASAIPSDNGPTTPAK